jgi:hypothetical protein
VIIGKRASEMSALLTLSYGKYAIKKSNVLKWQRLFEEGQDVKDVQEVGSQK